MDIHVDAFCQIVFMAGKTEWIAFANMQWSNRQYRPGWGMKLHADVLGLFGQEPGMLNRWRSLPMGRPPWVLVVGAVPELLMFTVMDIVPSTVIRCRET